MGFADRTANTALVYGVGASRQATEKFECLYFFYIFWSLATAHTVAVEEHLEVSNESCTRTVQRLYFGRYRYASVVWDFALTDGLPRGLRSHGRPIGPNDKAERFASDACCQKACYSSTSTPSGGGTGINNV